jgi:Bacterial PH domain
MGIEQHRDRVIGRIKQAISQSGINMSAIPADQQDRLVNTIGDGMLFEFDAILDAMSAAATTTTAAPSTDPAALATSDTHDEQVLWEGRPFLSLTERYVLTTDRIRMFSGLLSKGVENIELVRLQDVDYTQGLSERVLGIGDIALRSADASDPVTMLNNVKDPEQVSALIRKAWLDARKRYGVRFREEM